MIKCTDVCFPEKVDVALKQLENRNQNYPFVVLASMSWLCLFQESTILKNETLGKFQAYPALARVSWITVVTPAVVSDWVKQNDAEQTALSAKLEA